MGRTLLGIDLDESPVGGLIESLLSEEDLEKLADGGRQPGANDEDAGATDGDADADTEAGTDLAEDAVESDDGTTDETDDGTAVPVGTSDGAETPWDTPSPGVDATRLADTPSPGEEPGADDDGGWRATLRPLLLKGAIALAVLAVVALVVYRYLGTIKDVAGDTLPTDRFGGSDETDDAAHESPAEDFGADSPAARRRAKATDTDETSEFATELGGATDDTDEGGDTDTAEDEPETVGRPTDSDTGALVGLAMLALVAALVRKFGEGREYDPLVDGPRDDDA